MSIYRVATANTFDRTIQNINRRQSELAQAQEQLSSGKRVNRASDDAVAATLAERAQNRLARVQADQTALEASKSSLTLVEAGLGEANDLMVRARELVVQGGNPVLTQNSREDLARQLEGLRGIGFQHRELQIEAAAFGGVFDREGELAAADFAGKGVGIALIAQPVLRHGKGHVKCLGVVFPGCRLRLEVGSNKAGQRQPTCPEWCRF